MTESFTMMPASLTTKDIVAKLWNLCHILRDDGITYQHYVTELTYLLFLKMLAETGREDLLPSGFRWADLNSKEGEEQLTHYRRMMLELGDPQNRQVTSERVKAIFADAQTSLRKPTNLKALTDAIHKLDWFSAREEGLGNLYEGLLEKNAAEKKSGAGQYFTPRPLIDSIVRLMKPRAGEVIQDPAAGTGGFLVAADQYIKNETDDLYKLKESQQHFQRTGAFVGLELVHDTHRLCLMNMMLHGIEGGVTCGDTLSPDGQNLAKADLIMTNPPFGNRGAGNPTRNDFSITAGTSNKQLAFVEHIYRALKPHGRAVVVVPDNVLFDDNAGRRLRYQLMERCSLHTILRLPVGIFYAQGVKTNVLFFNKAKTEQKSTKAVWVYDLRANMSAFGKTRKLTAEVFADFEACFGDDPLCSEESLKKRRDTGEEGRFRRFTREWIAERQDALDISWLKDEEEEDVGIVDPVVVSQQIIDQLVSAVAEMSLVLKQLGGEAQVFSEFKKVEVESSTRERDKAPVGDLLKQLKQSILLSGTTGELTEEWRSKNGITMDSWQSEPARSVCSKVQSGKTPKEGFINEPGVPFLKVYNIVDQMVNFEYRPQYIAPEIHSGVMSNSRVEPGDVLMNIVGPPLGKVAIVPNRFPEWNLNQAITLFRPNDRICSEWIYYFLCSGQSIADIVHETRGSAGQVNISLTQCREFIFPIPTIDEQREIVKQIKQIFDSLDTIEHLIMASSNDRKRLLQSSNLKDSGEEVPFQKSDETKGIGVIIEEVKTKLRTSTRK